MFSLILGKFVLAHSVDGQPFTASIIFYLSVEKLGKYGKYQYFTFSN